MLERARTTLGVKADTARDLHVAAYNAHVRQWLGLPDRITLDDDGEDEDADNEQDVPSVNLDTLKFGEGAMEEVSVLHL
jgi:hypothetical protein